MRTVVVPWMPVETRHPVEGHPPARWNRDAAPKRPPSDGANLIERGNLAPDRPPHLPCSHLWSVITRISEPALFTFVNVSPPLGVFRRRRAHPFSLPSSSLQKVGPHVNSDPLRRPSSEIPRPSGETLSRAAVFLSRGNGYSFYGPPGWGRGAGCGGILSYAGRPW